MHDLKRILAGIDEGVYTMERNGIIVDTAFCDTQAEVAAGDIADRWAELVTVFGEERTTSCFGLPPQMGHAGESPKEIASLLHSELSLKPSPYWRKGLCKPGEIKCDATALGWLAREYPDYQKALVTMLELRKARACYKYLHKLPGFVASDGRVHPVFGAANDDDSRCGAVTGRLAVKLPELQQIPKNKKKDKYRIRKAFSAAAGNVILEADYTALEVVILAHITKVLFGDTDLEAACAPGKDIHSDNALYVYRDFLGMEGMEGITAGQLKEHPVFGFLRDLIKAVWYGLQYGKGAYGFGSTLFDEHGVAIGEERAGALVEGILTLRPAIRRYQDFVRQYITKNRGIPSLLGRWEDLSDLIPGKQWAENRAWRKALNFPMQAGGADIVGIAMLAVVMCKKLIALGFKLILQIHDALLFEGPRENAEEAGALVSSLMTTDMPLAVKLAAPAHFGDTWEDCH